MTEEIITFRESAAQGDLLIRLVDHIPQGYEKVETKDMNHVVAHSETGHHHVIPVSSAEMFAKHGDGMIKFMKTLKDDGMPIRHLRDFDTHTTLKAEAPAGSIYEIRNQKEHTPQGWRRVED